MSYTAHTYGPPSKGEGAQNVFKNLAAIEAAAESGSIDDGAVVIAGDTGAAYLVQSGTPTRLSFLPVKTYAATTFLDSVRYARTAPPSTTSVTDNLPDKSYS